MNFGPQLNVPVGTADNRGTHIGAWQGLTIKEILEKVDLSNIVMDDDVKKVRITVVAVSQSRARRDFCCETARIARYCLHGLLTLKYEPQKIPAPSRKIQIFKDPLSPSKNFLNPLEILLAHL